MLVRRVVTLSSRHRLIAGLLLVAALLAVAGVIGALGKPQSRDPQPVADSGVSGGVSSNVDGTAVPEVAPVPKGARPARVFAPVRSTGTAGTAGTRGSIASPTSEAPSVATQGTTRTSQGAPVAGGLERTRIERSGTLAIEVRAGEVGDTVTRLTALAARNGGYVDSSRTDTAFGTPSGEVVLRFPTARFDEVVSAAQHLGAHTQSLTTSATDVTGKYVDLAARITALRHTRARYFAILSNASTIGETLSVQDRIDEVQQQLERMQGEVKLLRSQTSDATLTVDVSEVGHSTAAPTTKHRNGFAAAWHRSLGRFNAGLQDIIAGLGPLLLVLLVLAVLAAVATAVRRVIRRPAAHSV